MTEEGKAQFKKRQLEFKKKQKALKKAQKKMAKENPDENYGYDSGMSELEDTLSEEDEDTN